MKKKLEELGEDLVRAIVYALVVDPEKVTIRAEATARGFKYHVWTAASDTGKLVGKDGRNAKAIRVVLAGCATKLRTQFEIDIREPGTEEA